MLDRGIVFNVILFLCCRNTTLIQDEACSRHYACDLCHSFYTTWKVCIVTRKLITVNYVNLYSKKKKIGKDGLFEDKLCNQGKGLRRLI